MVDFWFLPVLPGRTRRFEQKSCPMMDQTSSSEAIVELAHKVNWRKVVVWWRFWRSSKFWQVQGSARSAKSARTARTPMHHQLLLTSFLLLFASTFASESLFSRYVSRTLANLFTSWPREHCMVREPSIVKSSRIAGFTNHPLQSRVATALTEPTAQKHCQKDTIHTFFYLWSCTAASNSSNMKQY